MAEKNTLDLKKQYYGQFFTTTNPFDMDIFYKWLKLIPDYKSAIFLEPFAGSNHIVKMIKELGFKNPWQCFDINPGENNVAPEYPIRQKDTLAEFPTGFSAIITNPPYLARNSATRQGLPYPKTHYDNLYKLALEKMLDKSGNVAAIIPESYINASLFHERLFAFISLTCKMFEDTEYPVCLSLFLPAMRKKECGLDIDDFYVFAKDYNLGTYKTLQSKQFAPKSRIQWKFNNPAGSIGIKCVDDTKGPSIKFMEGFKISNEIKISSRSITRVSGLPLNIDLSLFLGKCNAKLYHYRKITADVFLTSFKGLRKDDRYRRRLDFENARLIMDTALDEIKGIQ